MIPDLNKKQREAIAFIGDAGGGWIEQDRVVAMVPRSFIALRVLAGLGLITRRWYAKRGRVCRLTPLGLLVYVGLCASSAQRGASA